MTCHCDSNPAQYERNRRFGHLVHVLDRAVSGAKLPSAGLRLNASKSESHLVTIVILLAPRVPWEGNARHVVRLRGVKPRPTADRALSKGETFARLLEPFAPAYLLYGTTTQSRGAKSSADDLGAGRGVVFSRAATTLRSIETQPPTGGFVSGRKTADTHHPRLRMACAHFSLRRPPHRPT
jgi:hypothetical protein